MKVYELKREQVASQDIEEVFAFFERPENLAGITPPSMDFSILTPSPVTMQSGALVDYTVKIMGIRSRWTTLITDYDPPHRFTDVQLRGPYSYWHHAHRFEPIDGGTRLVDEVRYVLPFGPLGQMAHALLVKRQLRKIFDHRMQVIDGLFNQAGQ